jgi:pullulanase
LQPSGIFGLWRLPTASAGLQDGRIYHYWFEVDNTFPGASGRILVCDPAAAATDWRVAEGNQPAAIVKFAGGELLACDASGDAVSLPDSGNLDRLPPNNQMVIYELPAAWTRQPPGGGSERGVGTFRDVLALVKHGVDGANFSDLAVTDEGRAYLQDLGVNAVELLPPADSIFQREWGYGTSHFMAPDMELGMPDGYSWPTTNEDLRQLTDAFHEHGIRLFVDSVLGFAREGPWQHIAFDEFHIVPGGAPDSDPDIWTSRPNERRQDWGSKLFRYAKPAHAYDPLTGTAHDHFPARSFHLTALTRWMRDFHVDGLRLDSIETVANWDFVGSYAALGRELFRERWQAAGLPPGDADARFLTVGEELNLPLDILTQGRVDALWNDNFRKYLRAALLGNNAEGESTFEWTVRKAIDCRLFGFSDGAQAVNYIGSHDVEGVGKERLCTFFRYNRFAEGEIERRVKLAFACLMTAVGIPMVLAGDEFGDENDIFDIRGAVSNNAGKQTDPVDFSRLEGEGNAWRRRVLDTVARLIRLRTKHPALGRNDVEFFHWDFSNGRRIAAWRRGATDNPVVVVANFSDFESGGDGEYRVPNWPGTPAGRHWREVSQARDIPDEWIGREPLFRWEAKVYTLR